MNRRQSGNSLPEAGGEQGAWAALLPLARDENRDAELIHALLERWCRDFISPGAALYLAHGEVLRLEQSWGEGNFPEILSGSVPPGCHRLELPGGVLLHLPAARGAAERSMPGQGPEPLSAFFALTTRLQTLKRRLKRYNFEAGLRGVEQHALYDVGLAITSTLNLDALIDAILSWALSLLDARQAALYLMEGGLYRLSKAMGGTARPAFQPASGGELPRDLLPGAVHLLAAPIEVEDSTRGLLVVADKESRRGVGPFGDGDRRTLTLFANQAAIALENAHLHRQALEKERLEREMELAADIQREILPDASPEVPGYELAGWNRPARQVGGDYYDLLPVADGRLVVTVGDVSGKGMPAALMVSTLHSALRLMLDRHDFGPALIERLNRHVLDSSAPNKFITLLTAELDPGEHRLRYINAGHNPGLVVGREGEVRHLASSGLPVGLLPGSTYQMSAVHLGEGDLVCLYSDGITEASNPEDEEFDLHRLVDLLRQHRDEPLPELLRAVDEAATAFAAGAPQGDDQTVVLLRRNAPGA